MEQAPRPGITLSMERAYLPEHPLVSTNRRRIKSRTNDNEKLKNQ
jgi:hypothetical protein